MLQPLLTAGEARTLMTHLAMTLHDEGVGTFARAGAVYPADTWSTIEILEHLAVA